MCQKHLNEFDRRIICLFKLRQNGIDGKLLEWLNSYLSLRKQKVCFKSGYSALKFIFAGVPQGSVLGPLLFLVYVHDIAKQLLSLTRLFANDSSLFHATANIADLAGIINHDLQLLSNWAKLLPMGSIFFPLIVAHFKTCCPLCCIVHYRSKVGL